MRRLSSGAEELDSAATLAFLFVLLQLTQVPVTHFRECFAFLELRENASSTVLHIHDTSVCDRANVSCQLTDCNVCKGKRLVPP